MYDTEILKITFEKLQPANDWNDYLLIKIVDNSFSVDQSVNKAALQL